MFWQKKVKGESENAVTVHGATKSAHARDTWEASNPGVAVWFEIDEKYPPAQDEYNV